MQRELESFKINVIQIPLECYPFALPSPTPTHGQKISFQASSHGDPPARRGATFAVGLVSPSDHGSSRYLYKIENSSEILMKLENDAIQLKIYLASPHISGLRQKVDMSLDTVSKLQELIHLLEDCQNQVLKLVLWYCVMLKYIYFLQWEHLLSLVKQIQPHLHKAVNLSNLQKAGTQFQDITKSIRIDPRLLSLMEKRRGQKGFRELQGEALRNLCNTISELLVSITTTEKQQRQ